MQMEEIKKRARRREYEDLVALSHWDRFRERFEFEKNSRDKLETRLNFIRQTNWYPVNTMNLTKGG